MAEGKGYGWYESSHEQSKQGDLPASFRSRIEGSAM